MSGRPAGRSSRIKCGFEGDFEPSFCFGSIDVAAGTEGENGQKRRTNVISDIE